MGVVVALSKVADGSMYDRTQPEDQKVIENRATWLHSHGFSLDDATRLYITYGDDKTYKKYLEVNASDMGKGMRANDIEWADALVTTIPGQVLFLPVADCIATTFYDEAHGVLMLSHLGRHSLEVNGAVESVRYLQTHYDSKPEDIQVWLSASISKDAYPITKLDGKGMKEVIHEQLAKAGIVPEHIIEDAADTGTNPEYFSHSEFLKGNKPSDGCHAMMAVITSPQS